jgi:uncharacterized protein DUF2786
LNANISNASGLIAKIQKLRALAQSANVHEAAAAAAAAEKLIQEHSLSEAELEVGAAGLDDPVLCEEAAVLPGRKLATWQTQLLVVLCQSYQCSGFYRRSVARNGALRSEEPGSRFMAYGRKQDVEMLRYQFAWFSAEVTRLALKFGQGQGRTYANSFRLGAVQAISASLFEARRAARNQASSQALVLVDSRAEKALAQRDQDHPDLVTRSRSAGNVDPEGYAAGQRAGALLSQKGHGKLAAGPGRQLERGGK